MRSFVSRRRIKNLLIATSVVALGACSSGFERFDYQAASPQPASNSQNPYPGNVDSTTTASTGGRLEPAAPVAPRIDPNGIYHRPEPTYAANQVQPNRSPQYQAPQYQTPQYQVPRYQTHQRQPLNNYSQQRYSQPSYPARSSYNSSRVQSSSLPAASAPARSGSNIRYTPPKPEAGANTVYIPPSGNQDTITTAAVAKSEPREQGWTATGGTRFRVRQGETLYNLSKRYGVPVHEIRRANNLRADAQLQADQVITIPNYVYGPRARVSAPDNDPKTRAASAGTGKAYQPMPEKVVVPERRPSISSQPSLAQAPVTQGQIYVVRPGDSLSRIASRSGSTVSALQRANGLTSSTIRVGQRLKVPGGIDPTTTASVSTGTTPYGVDPIVTGSTGNTQRSSATPATSSELTAPKQTGISNFRWPVRGRVIERFGDKVAEGVNEGIDITVPEGTAVRAAENGVVIYTGEEISEYGKLVLIRHTDGWVSAYAHNRKFEVMKGEKVARGQIIARSGRTGQASAPKLHFELRKNSVAVDPTRYLSGA